MKKYDIKNRTKRAISIEGRRTPLAPGETIAAVYMPEDRAERYAATPAHFEIKPHVEPPTVPSPLKSRFKTKAPKGGK